MKISFREVIIAIIILIIASLGIENIIFLIIAGFLVFAIVSIFTVKKVVSKGKEGEKIVSKYLKKIAFRRDGRLVNNVIIPSDEGKTSQIDHVLFVGNHIYVIETKNYSGRIYGKTDQREWTQVLAGGNRKNKFYNPVMQNYTHVRRLKELLGSKHEFYSCVVFVGGTLMNGDVENLYTFNEFKKFIKANSYKLNPMTDIDFAAYYTLEKLKKHPIQSEEEHISEIKEMRKMIANNICPRCGGNLVFRQTEEGSFYGCENYPKCRFTKNK